MAKHRILVIGAGGKSGTPVVEQAIAAGHDVVALVRDPARAAHLPKAATIVKGDALDAASIRGAAAGCDVIIITVGDRSNMVSGAAAAHAVAALKGTPNGRIILLSAYGIGNSAHGVHGFLLTKVMSRLNTDKIASEAALLGSGLDWVVVRPPVLGEGPQSAEPLKAGIDVKINGFQTVLRSDVAAFMLAQLDSSEFVGQKPIVYRT